MEPEGNARVRRLHVPPVYVLTVRRRLADQREVAAALAERLPEVAEMLTGPPMALRLGLPRNGKTDFELAFPVATGVEQEGYAAKTLPTLPMLAITHAGALDGGPEGTNLAHTWGRFVEFVRSRSILVGDDPSRYLYHQGLSSVGSAGERVVLEVQYPYHLPLWLDALRRGVADRAGEDAAERVMAGSHGLADALDGAWAADWAQGAVDRLDRELPDERDRARVLNACAHHYIVQSGEILGAAWEDVGHDLGRLVSRINEETLLGGRYEIDTSGPEPLLLITRRPARQEAYDRADDPVEKRYQACFCPLVREAIRGGKAVSRSFCHCSAGWYVQEWEIVFGEPPEVLLLDTMLEGADACRFAVKIPPGVL